MNVDVEDLIARVRATIRVEYIEYASRKRKDRELDRIADYLEGYEVAADTIEKDLSRIIHYAVVDQQKASES